jgi:hypothetical protein
MVVLLAEFAPANLDLLSSMEDANKEAQLYQLTLLCLQCQLFHQFPLFLLLQPFQASLLLLQLPFNLLLPHSQFNQPSVSQQFQLSLSSQQFQFNLSSQQYLLLLFNLLFQSQHL